MVVFQSILIHSSEEKAGNVTQERNWDLLQLSLSDNFWMT